MAGAARQSLHRGGGRQGRAHRDRLRRVRCSGNVPDRRARHRAVPPRRRHDSRGVAAGIHVARQARRTAMITRRFARNASRGAALALALALSMRVLAIDVTVLPDAEKQARYEAMTHELRCMQCMNNSIADSPVGLASDLRRDVAEQIMAGKTDDEIRASMVKRYGNVILFTPPLDRSSAWVWLTPVVAAVGGLLIGITIVRRRSKLVELDDSVVETDDGTR